MCSFSAYPKIPSPVFRYMHRRVQVLLPTFPQSLLPALFIPLMMPCSSNDQIQPDNAWEFQAPYKQSFEDSSFTAAHVGHCHCGRIEYQISRDAPLDAKFCHCRTCRVLHGKCVATTSIRLTSKTSLIISSTFYRRSFPMGSHLSQRGCEVCEWRHGFKIL